MSQPIHAPPSIHRPLASRARRWLHRHELHRAADGDWSAEQPTHEDPRRALVVGLAVVATLPVTAMLLEGWPDAPSEVLASIASLPLLALVLATVAWRSHQPGRGDR
jgi:hypothetical protein